MNPDPTPVSWLCPTLSARERAVDMEHRLQPVRKLTMLALAVTLLACGPWLGFWTLAPLAVATVGFLLVDRGLDRAARPELRIAVAWVISMVAIAASVAASGGPGAPTVSWLVLPVVTLPARFGTRGLVVGSSFAAVLIAAVTVGVHPSEVSAQPDLLLTPLALLFGVAALLMALMRSDLHHRSAAVIDPLTGMLNRAALATRAGELAQQAQVVGLPVGVIVGDLDRFKAVNDVHGHATGDAVLQEVAYRLRKHLRAFDLAYRLGGEEFVVLVPGASVTQAADVAETLRAAIDASPIAGLTISMSFGVAASTPGTFDFEEVFDAADRVLYEAKAQGRNRVCTAEKADAGRPLAAA